MKHVEFPGFNPCPFCGERNFSITDKKSFDYVSRDSEEVVVYIYCRNCFVTMDDAISSDKDFEKRIAMLRDKWNRRVV